MPTLQDKEDSLMKLNSKRIDFEYTPGEEIFTFPEDTGLPFFFDVDEELTDNPSAMDAVGEMLDEAEKLAEKAKAHSSNATSSAFILISSLADLTTLLSCLYPIN